MSVYSSEEGSCSSAEDQASHVVETSSISQNEFHVQNSESFGSPKSIQNFTPRPDNLQIVQKKAEDHVINKRPLSGVMPVERYAGRTSPSTPYLVENFRQITRLRRELQNMDSEMAMKGEIPELNSFCIGEQNPFAKSKQTPSSYADYDSAKRVFDGTSANRCDETEKAAILKLNYGDQNFSGFIWEVDGLQPLFATFPVAPKVTVAKRASEGALRSSKLLCK